MGGLQMGTTEATADSMAPGGGAGTVATAALPPHWTEHLDPDKGVYYFNANTGESAWEHPMDDYYRKLFKSLHKNKEEMLRLMQEQSLFQLSQVGLKTNALLKEHNQVLASLMLAQNPNSGLDAPNMLQR